MKSDGHNPKVMLTTRKWCSQPLLNRRIHSWDFLIWDTVLFISGNNYGKLGLLAKMLHLTLRFLLQTSLTGFKRHTWFHVLFGSIHIIKLNYWLTSQTMMLLFKVIQSFLSVLLKQSLTLIWKLAYTCNYEIIWI